jgi:putative lipoic acid-binding regulatory protein
MEDVFGKLRAQLEQEEWPAVYLFKFIVPRDAEKLAKVTAMFNGTNDITFNHSKNGNFVSVSVKELMLDVDSIIEKYEQAAKIKGVIAL